MTTKEETTMEETVQDPAAVLAELRRAQDDLKALRAELNEAKTGREAAEKALEENTPDEWKKRALTAETRVALSSQGIKDVDRLINYVGTDGLDFDDNGKITGLDERMTQLKKDLPEVFDAKRRAGGKGDIFANDVAEVKQDPFREAIKNSLHGG